MEPVALQVRCIHCHRRRCNCADRRALATQVQLRDCHPCRCNCADSSCAAVTAIWHPARARSQLLRLTMGWHVLWSQWRCSGHCDGSGLDASRLNSARADLLCAWAKRRSDCRRCDCHRRRCNCADRRCAAVTAIRHPARARSQLLRLTMGWHVLWSQWRCSIPTACDLRTAAFTAIDADASRALATQVQLRDCHRRRCNCATATHAGATAPIAAAPL